MMFITVMNRLYPKRNNGFTLVEALISMLVFAVAAMGLARFSLGKLSEIMDMVHGLNVASPTPMLMRARNMCAKFLAMPDATVAADQRAMPAPTIQVRRFLSASQPSGRPMVA